MNFSKIPNYSYIDLSNSIRIIAADAIERANSGHPGMPLGMADVMTVLAVDFLQFNPSDPKWPNRDRLILSAGHGSMLLYAFYYLTGYRNFTLNDVRNFRQLNSKAPGHPEYGAYEAIETTTGPLGQGLANAVGMAIAEKKYKEKLGPELIDYKIYCIVGDGCLMEGISYEAASLAGHLGLNNLVVLFDDNRISIDGRTKLAVSENHLDKFISLGWNVSSIDGHDFDQINAALLKAQNSNRPSFISCRTLIGKGCKTKVDSELCHGAPLGKNEVSSLKEKLGFAQQEFDIPLQLLEIWRHAWMRNKENYDSWQSIGSNFVPEQVFDFSISDFEISGKPESTRVSSGKFIEKLLETNQQNFSIADKMVFGSADLSLSNNIKNKESAVISKNDFRGNFIHYGVREHAMAGIMNGLAISGFLPVGGTFFVFSDYMKPAIRLAAMMKLQVIYVMTHDSIGVGEDGPTHQPVEHLAAMRAAPNLLVLRPADALETRECWQIALEHKTGPSMLVLTRQNVPQLRKDLEIHSYNSSDEINEDRMNLSSKGAYVISPFDTNSQIANDYALTIFASGSELSIALEVADILNHNNMVTRVVSIPSFELFFKQDPEYIKSLTNSPLKVAIEAGSSFGWHKIIGENGLFFGVEEFGLSAPSEQLYKYFGLDTKTIAEVIMKEQGNCI